MCANGSLTVLQVAYPLAPVSADTVGGAEQIVATLDEFLTRHGHRSLVAATSDSRVAGTLLPTDVEERRFGSREKADVHERHRRTVERAIRDYAPDIVHIHALEPERYASRQAPTLTTLHLRLDHYSHEGRALSNLVCVSESQRGALHAEVIPNGVRSCEPPRHRRTVCVSLGRICPEKGFHHALRATRAAGVPMMLAGEVFPYPEHQQYFRERLEPSLDRGRRFIGPVGRTAKMRLLAICDITVMRAYRGAWERSDFQLRQKLHPSSTVVARLRGAGFEASVHDAAGLGMRGEIGRGRDFFLARKPR